MRHLKRSRTTRTHGTQFTCFTSTKVQILTPKVPRFVAEEEEEEEEEEESAWVL